MLDCTHCNHHCQQCKSMCSGELGTHTRCAVVMHEIMWDSADSWIRLTSSPEHILLQLLTMVIAMCTIKHLWIWTCYNQELTAPCSSWAFLSISFTLNLFFLITSVLVIITIIIASLTSYWTKLYRKLAACSLYHTGVMLEQLGTKVLMPRVDYASLQPCCSLWLFVQLELYSALSLDYAVVVAMSCFCMWQW